MRTRRWHPSAPAAWLLALALLLAQGAGLWHRVLHPPLPGAAAARSAAGQGTAFDGHAGDDGACRLYDAHGLSAGLLAVAAALPVAPALPDWRAAGPAACPPAARAHAYLARGPPA